MIFIYFLSCLVHFRMQFITTLNCRNNMLYKYIPLPCLLDVINKSLHAFKPVQVFCQCLCYGTVYLGYTHPKPWFKSTNLHKCLACWNCFCLLRKNKTSLGQLFFRTQILLHCLKIVKHFSLHKVRRVWIYIKRIIMSQNPVTLKTVIEFICLCPFAFITYLVTVTQIRLSTVLAFGNLFQNQNVTLNLSALNHTVRKWNKRSQSEPSGQLVETDLHVKGREKNRPHYRGILHQH